MFHLSMMISTVIPSPPYSNYFDNANNTTNHGTHVTHTMRSSTYGWAREANIYSMQVLGNSDGLGTPVSPLLMFDYLRAFHRHKPINPETGFRNPTITNHSWGYKWKVVDDFSMPSLSINEIQYVIYQGDTYDSNNPGPSGWTIDGIEEDFGIFAGSNEKFIPSDYPAIKADVGILKMVSLL